MGNDCGPCKRKRISWSLRSNNWNFAAYHHRCCGIDRSCLDKHELPHEQIEARCSRLWLPLRSTAPEEFHSVSEVASQIRTIIRWCSDTCCKKRFCFRHYYLCALIDYTLNKSHRKKSFRRERDMSKIRTLMMDKTKTTGIQQKSKIPGIPFGTWIFYALNVAFYP